jgi:hypothetical protein
VYESFHCNASVLTTCPSASILHWDYNIVVPDLAYRIGLLKSWYLWISEQQIFAMQKIYLQSSHQPLITMPHLNIFIIISAVPRLFRRCVFIRFYMNFQNNPDRESPRFSPGFSGGDQRPRTKPPLGHYSSLCNWNRAYIHIEFGLWFFVRSLFINYSYKNCIKVYQLAYYAMHFHADCSFVVKHTGTSGAINHWTSVKSMKVHCESIAYPI